VSLADFYRDGHRDALAGHGILCQHPEYLAGYREGLKDRASSSPTVLGEVGSR
jgi:hypothetical protein